MKAMLIVAATALLRVVPSRMAEAIAGAAGTVCWLLLTTRRRTLLENLTHTAPTATPAERRRLSRATFRNFAWCTLDLLRAPHLSADDMRARIEIDGRHHLDTAIAAGRGVVLVSPHLGAIELGGRCMTAFGYSAAGTARTPTPINPVVVFDRVVYTPLHSAAEGWIHSNAGQQINGLINTIAGSYVIGDGADGTEAVVVEEGFFRHHRPGDELFHQPHLGRGVKHQHLGRPCGLGRS